MIKSHLLLLLTQIVVGLSSTIATYESSNPSLFSTTDETLSTTGIPIADLYPLWDYDWSSVVTQSQWYFLLAPRPWTWTKYECLNDCCDVSCANMGAERFEDCIANTNQTCQFEAYARVSIQPEDFHCLIRNPSYGDYILDGSYLGWQLEWDISWIPLGSNPYWVQWDRLENDCVNGTVYLRSAESSEGTCKPELTWGNRQQKVNSTSIGISYDGLMSNSYGATRTMMMMACKTINLDWNIVDPHFVFKVSSFGLQGLITPIERPSTTPLPLTLRTAPSTDSRPAVKSDSASNALKFISMILSFFIIVHA